jgi:dipeptidase E
VAPAPQIVGFGGGADTAEQDAARVAHVAGLAGGGRLRICFVPTAVAESSDSIDVFLASPWGRHGELSVVHFFPWPRPDLREHILEQDVVVVSGGNTANMLAIWRVHGFDATLREAWQAGVVLTGGSAGMICWFEAGVTDSFGPQLEGMADGLAFLPGSACPHYDGEAERRPRYRELIASGFPGGIAAEDGVGLHYVGTELVEAVTCRPGAAAYRVTAAGEERLEARLL